LAQEELARRTGITQATLSNLERGRTRMPSPDHRRRLAAALGIGHVDLLVAAGEVAPDELEAWARRNTAGPDVPDWWGAPVVARLREEPEDSARARLAVEVARLTRREAGFVLLIVDGLPTEAREMRRAGGSAEDYLQWRDSSDALEVL